DGSPDQVWAVIRDVGKISDWFPAFAESWIEGEDNATRIGVLGDGGRVVERIESTDDQARRLTYRIDDSPLPLASYRSSMTVSPAGTGSRVDWHTEFEPAGITADELHDILKGLYDDGLAALKQQLDG
ncbi:MAG: SRPBCC family protein, partial [Inquilinus sp.]|nr:SRPBCC family protein [Inquilinus sp.]